MHSLILPYLCLLQIAFLNHPYMTGCKFARKGHTAQKGIKQGRSKQTQNQPNNLMVVNNKVDTKPR